MRAETKTRIAAINGLKTGNKLITYRARLNKGVIMAGAAGVLCILIKPGTQSAAVMITSAKYWIIKLDLKNLINIIDTSC